MNSDIRAGLAANLATITGLQVNDRSTSNPVNPSVQIMPGPTEYDLAANRGLDKRTWRVVVLVPDVVEASAQTVLDGFMDKTGSSSVKTAIESDRTLGGTVQNLHVTGDNGQQLYTDQTPPALGCEWTVEIWARGQ